MAQIVVYCWREGEDSGLRTRLVGHTLKSSADKLLLEWLALNLRNRREDKFACRAVCGVTQKNGRPAGNAAWLRRNVDDDVVLSDTLFASFNVYLDKGPYGTSLCAGGLKKLFETVNETYDFDSDLHLTVRSLEDVSMEECLRS